MRRVMKRKEEEEIIRRKRLEKFEKIQNLEVQEMGILSIITKKPNIFGFFTLFNDDLELCSR